MWEPNSNETLHDSSCLNAVDVLCSSLPELNTSEEDTGGSLSMGDNSVTSQSGEMGMMGLNRKDKLCLVCGDKALGYNFNAVSCESCKAFFRRNAHKTIRGRCEGKCDVTVESRSFCKRCRLAKCYTVGMRRDMILNEEQKIVRKQKIMFNKLRRQGRLPSDVPDFPAPNDLVSSATPVTLAKDEKLKKEATHAQQQTSSAAKSSSPATSYPSWAECQDLMNNTIDQLPEELRKLVLEMQYAMEQSCFLAETTTTLRSLPTTPTEFVNMAEGFVRKVIKLAKNIASFKTLQKDDQVSLLKGSVVDIMMLRSAVNYDVRTESWSLSTKDCLSSKSTAASASGVSGVHAGGSAESSLSSPPTGCPTVTSSVTKMDNPSTFAAQYHPHSLTSAPTATPGVGHPLTSSDGAPSSSTGPSGSGRISAELLKMGSPETHQLFINYSKFIKSLMSSIHGDVLVLKLLIMMSLFSADRSTLVEREKVQAVQEKYASVLQKYTSLRFADEKTLFANLIMRLTDVRNINEVHSKMLLKMKISSIEPLLLEVFDLG